jgi:hypothetical protein
VTPESACFAVYNAFRRALVNRYEAIFNVLWTIEADLSKGVHNKCAQSPAAYAVAVAKKKLF